MKRLKIGARAWRRLRQVTQVLALALFMYLFLYATFLTLGLTSTLTIA